MVSGCGSSRPSTSPVPERAELVFMDQSENGYLLRGQRSLIKYDFRNHPTDRYDFDFTIRETGLSSDLRIYAFNPDFQTFYILDKYLNEVTRYPFSEYFDFLAQHPILVNGQTIWLYNPSEDKLQKYSTRLELLNESRNLSWEVPRLRIDQMIFHQNELYVIDHQQGVFIFDFSGRMVQRIPLPPLTRDAQIDQSTSDLFIYFSRQWHVIDLKDRMPSYQTVEITDADRFADDHYIFQNGKVYHWNPLMQQIEIAGE